MSNTYEVLSDLIQVMRHEARASGNVRALSLLTACICAIIDDDLQLEEDANTPITQANHYTMLAGHGMRFLIVNLSHRASTNLPHRYVRNGKEHTSDDLFEIRKLPRTYTIYDINDNDRVDVVGEDGNLVSAPQPGRYDVFVAQPTERFSRVMTSLLPAYPPSHYLTVGGAFLQEGTHVAQHAALDALRVICGYTGRRGPDAAVVIRADRAICFSFGIMSPSSLSEKFSYGMLLLPLAERASPFRENEVDERNALAITETFNQDGFLESLKLNLVSIPRHPDLLDALFGEKASKAYQALRVSEVAAFDVDAIYNMPDINTEPSADPPTVPVVEIFRGIEALVEAARTGTPFASHVPASVQTAAVLLYQESVRTSDGAASASTMRLSEYYRSLQQEQNGVEPYYQLSDTGVLGMYTDQLAEHYGITNEVERAGYILSDGRLLDFSGGHKDPVRAMDHRDIIVFADTVGIAAGRTRHDTMLALMEMLSLVRIHFANGALVVSAQHTPSGPQLMTILRIAARTAGIISAVTIRRTSYIDLPSHLFGAACQYAILREGEAYTAPEDDLREKLTPYLGAQ